MTAFATEAELEAYTGTSIDSTRATLLLDLATGAIRAYTGQTLSQVSGDVVTLPGTFDNALVLPERPVTAVTTVVVNDLTLAVNGDYVWPGSDVLLRGSRIATPVVNGPDWLLGGFGDWGGPSAEVVVTYTHGFATIPSDIKGVCLALAARSLTSPDGVNSETVGSYSVSYSRTGGAVSLLSEEKALLDRYRRTVFA